MRTIRVALMVGLVGCRQTELEACEEFFQIACDCDDDPFNPEEDDGDGCQLKDVAAETCASSSDEERAESDWACTLRKYRKTCDYDEALDECGYSEE